MLSEDHAKHASNSPVTFVAHKRFAVIFFLGSYCVNSLLWETEERREKRRTVNYQGSAVLCVLIHIVRDTSE